MEGQEVFKKDRVVFCVFVQSVDGASNQHYGASTHGRTELKALGSASLKTIKQRLCRRFGLHEDRARLRTIRPPQPRITITLIF